jgi:hypothetical protein
MSQQVTATPRVQAALDAKIRAATQSLNGVSNAAAKVWATALGNALGKAQWSASTAVAESNMIPAASLHAESDSDKSGPIICRRAPKFLPSGSLTESIFKQLRTKVPWAYSRCKVSEIWMEHLKALHGQGLALECTKFKTLSAWATRICKRRKARRSQEETADDAIDEVTLIWKICKLGGCAHSNPSNTLQD